jgi:hypothetical protein
MKPSRSSLGLWARRLGWMVLLWTASVAALAIAALILRALMAVAGLTT